jgi:hypothetical protein
MQSDTARDTFHHSSIARRTMATLILKYTWCLNKVAHTIGGSNIKKGYCGVHIIHMVDHAFPDWG